MFFPQDPMILYQQSAAYLHASASSRTPQPRPSFLIDDLLVPRQHPYLLPKQGNYPDHLSPSVPSSSSGDVLKFGVPSNILSRPAENDPSAVYQDPSPEVLNSLPVYFRLKPTLRTPSGRRCRKSRTVFTELQLRVLEKTFAEQKYLDTSNRAKVAQTLGLNETQVKTWFQNRRMKWKKETKQARTQPEDEVKENEKSPCPNKEKPENEDKVAAVRGCKPEMKAGEDA